MFPRLDPSELEQAGWQPYPVTWQAVLHPLNHIGIQVKLPTLYAEYLSQIVTYIEKFCPAKKLVLCPFVIAKYG